MTETSPPMVEPMTMRTRIPICFVLFPGKATRGGRCGFQKTCRIRKNATSCGRRDFPEKKKNPRPGGIGTRVHLERSSRLQGCRYRSRATGGNPPQAALYD